MNITFQLRSLSLSLRRSAVVRRPLWIFSKSAQQGVDDVNHVTLPTNTSAQRGVDEINHATVVPTNDCPDTIPQEFLVEQIPSDGEWAGCSRKFMSPLQISVRGAGTGTYNYSQQPFSLFLGIHPFVLFHNTCNSFINRCTYQPII